MNIYIAYEINLWPFRGEDNFTLGSALYGSAELTKNVDKDKYKYSGYGIGFDKHGTFSLFYGNGYGKNVIIIGADMSFSLHVDNKKKDVLKRKKMKRTNRCVG